MSGGGGKSAFSVGVLRHLLSDLNTDYNIICGVSAGAIIAGFLGQYPFGQGSEAIEALAKLWLSLDDTKIYKPWPVWGRLATIWRKSFFDSSPLHALVRATIDLEKIRASGKNIFVGAISISSGEHAVFDQHDPDFINCILASSSFPILLSPVKMKNQLWVDGGVKELLLLKSAIEKGCEEIDIISTMPDIHNRKFIEKPSIIDLIKRITDISTDTILSHDIDRVMMHNKLAAAGIEDKKVIKLRFFRPHTYLSDDVLNFDPAKIKEMMAKGYQIAQEICTTGDANNTALEVGV
jgi:NTE family protein